MLRVPGVQHILLGGLLQLLQPQTLRLLLRMVHMLHVLHLLLLLHMLLRLVLQLLLLRLLVHLHLRLLHLHLHVRLRLRLLIHLWHLLLLLLLPVLCCCANVLRLLGSMSLGCVAAGALCCLQLLQHQHSNAALSPHALYSGCYRPLRDCTKATLQNALWPCIPELLPESHNEPCMEPQHEETRATWQDFLAQARC